MTSTIRGLRSALNAGGKYSFKSPDYSIDHLVIGGGVVGLAVAKSLVAKFPEKSTFLIERNGRVGEETSSRNSEVIHAGLYYPANSLKTRLCVEGRHLLYDYCRLRSVPHRAVGKLVVGRADQRPYLEGLARHAASLFPSVPAQIISGDEARALEPDISHDIAVALRSPTTGIVDSHSLMESLEQDIVDNGGNIALSTRVVRVDPYSPSGSEEGGWVVQTLTAGSTETDTLLARTVVNSTGLASALVLNSLLPYDQRIAMYFAKGSYAVYRGPGVSNVRGLIYPVPETGPKKHGFAGLGTHLTLDMEGNVRFGPDIEWLTPPEENADGEEAVDFWKKHLTPSEERVAMMFGAVSQYLPGVKAEGLKPDYVGIRPKLSGPGTGFQDFVVRKHRSGQFLGDDSRGGGTMISLLGIESPGLTSSLAIGEMVVGEVLDEC